MASEMPCAVAGCLKWLASPISAHPGPAGRRKNPRSIVSGAERISVIRSAVVDRVGIERGREVAQGGQVGALTRRRARRG